MLRFHYLFFLLYIFIIVCFFYKELQVICVRIWYLYMYHKTILVWLVNVDDENSIALYVVPRSFPLWINIPALDIFVFINWFIYTYVNCCRNSKGYELATKFNSKFTHLSPVWYDLKRYAPKSWVKIVLFFILVLHVLAWLSSLAYFVSIRNFQ